MNSPPILVVASLLALAGVGMLVTTVMIKVIDPTVDQSQATLDNVRREVLLNCMLTGQVVIGGKAYRCLAIPADQITPEGDLPKDEEKLKKGVRE
jgi:hypothetical protein